jgi:hypothetical protein
MKRKQRKAVIGAMIKRLQKLDALEDTTITKIVLNYIRKKRVARMKRIANSKFYSDFLFPKWRELAQKGFYFIGDSAYSVKSFILPPFNDVLHGSEEDNFNYFHSSARIAVECAFGEIELRWGIFIEAQCQYHRCLYAVA